MMASNRVHNLSNPHQGDYKKVLCVCSAGLLRSPTTAEVLSRVFDYNTRAVGLDVDYALIPIDQYQVDWADEIVCMGLSQKVRIDASFVPKNPVVNLEIPDIYGFRDPDLIQMVEANYRAHLARD